MQILRRADLANVDVVPGQGVLGDHYDPLHKRLVLSPDNFSGQSVAALGVAAHETRRAIQHASGYAPLQLRTAAVGLTTFASQIVTFLPLLFMFTGIIAPYTGLMLMAACWGVIMLFNLVTLPVEFDAPRRAKKLLVETGMISPGPEAEGVNRVLNAAACWA